MKEKLTILIPTHNRAMLVDRSLHYYSGWDCEIIICDSSEVIHSVHTEKNIRHIHYPGRHFSKKIAEALELVSTPFVCLCADDDFLTMHGIDTAIHFLETHSDYVSAQGRYLQFWLHGEQVVPVPLYTKAYGLTIDQENAKDRILASVQSGMHQLYSLHRTEVLKNTFSVCGDEKPPTLTECSSNLVGMFYGKHLLLPVFWMARDTARYTVYNYNRGDANTIFHKKQLREYLLSEESAPFKARFANLYATVTGVSLSEAEELFTDIFLHRFFSEQSVVPKKKSIMARIRSAAAWDYILKRIKKILPAQWMANRYRRAFPFPFPEKPEYAADWESIEKSILKYGHFANYSGRVKG